MTRRPLPMKRKVKLVDNIKSPESTEKILDSLMKAEPEEKDISAIWEHNWRPNVVICVTHGAKVLMCYHERFALWQFPQGGIEPGESAVEALAWELSEELGEDFAQRCSSIPVFLGADRIPFRSKAKVKTNPTEGEPEEVKIKGKVYYIYQLVSETADIDVETTDFSKVQWCSFKEASSVCDSIYQVRKQELTRKTLSLLLEIGAIE